jgi:hypothetical protein
VLLDVIGILHMNNSIYDINFNIDKDKLIEESNHCQFVPINRVTMRLFQLSSKYTKGKKFTDYLNKKDNDWWKRQDSWHTSINADTKLLSKMPETTRILSIFKERLETNEIEANFFTQKVGTSAKMHADVGTACAINFILKGDETPIMFEEDGTFYYKNALINVSKKHMVPEQTSTDRILFKLRILNMPFEEVREKLICTKEPIYVN